MSQPPADRPDLPREPAARWRRWLHTAAEPLFLISGQRRLAYANPAWEKLTGIAFAEARGRACRRRPRAAAVEPVDQVLTALAPPPEALQGHTCRARHRAPGPALAWWEIDFFPWSDADGLLAILGRIHVVAESGPVHAALPEKLVQLRERFHQNDRLESWTSAAPAMHRLAQQLRLAGSTRLPILIQGPPGSGKTWAARTIHQLSEQRESFFATFDPRLPPAILAEMLSSSRHWRLGSIYVADVQRLPSEAQALLLQHLETDTENPGPRIMVGSTTPANDLARAGRLLPELHAHLTTLTIDVPALADRLVDLPQLVDRMLPRVNQVVERQVRTLSHEALDHLRRHLWPENLRELYDVLVQACRHTKGEQLAADDLPFYLRNPTAPPAKTLPLDEILEKVERRVIELALRMAPQNKTRAAELLGIWRPRLLRRLEQLGLDPEST